MTPAQIALARHALGLPNRKRKSFRNHFVAGVGHDDYADWQAMVDAGLARRRAGNQLTGDDVLFFLTRAGAEAALLPRERLDAADFPVAIDRPIIFSTPMVCALLAGRKTMTRRLAWTGGPKAARDGTITIRGSFAPRPSPWQGVKPGDRLWVREAHTVEAAGHEDGTGRLILYRATEPAAPTIWTPSIHMPRWASRLTLVVTAVRVERLQAITDADAIAEGLWSRPADFDPRILLWHWEPEGGRVVRAAGWEIPKGAFCNLWERLHGRESWFANPEVVAITFAVPPRNIDGMDPAA